MHISERIRAISEMVRTEGILADVGCDHAYLPILLCRSGKIRGAIAMDVREGPLRRAEEHIRACGLQDRIRIRLSDGLEKLERGEADAIVIAGMGGRLMIRILADGMPVVSDLEELILAPQSEPEKVRIFVTETSFGGTWFSIQEERMVQEEGKYYPVIRFVPCAERPIPLAPEEALFGPDLLCRRDPVLERFLKNLKERDLHLADSLQKSAGRERSASAEARLAEVREELACIERAEKYFQK